MQSQNRWGRQGRRVALCVMEGLECMELTFGSATLESLWVRIKRQKIMQMSSLESVIDLSGRMMMLMDYSSRN